MKFGTRDRTARLDDGLLAVALTEHAQLEPECPQRIVEKAQRHLATRSTPVSRFVTMFNLFHWQLFETTMHALLLKESSSVLRRDSAPPPRSHLRSPVPSIELHALHSKSPIETLSPILGSPENRNSKLEPRPPKPPISASYAPHFQHLPTPTCKRSSVVLLHDGLAKRIHLKHHPKGSRLKPQ